MNENTPSFKLRRALAYTLYACWRIYRFFFLSWSRSWAGKLAIIALLLILVLGIFPSLRPSLLFSTGEQERLPKNERGEERIIDATATHACQIEPFSQTLMVDASVQYTIALTPSLSGKDYELVLGNLPEHVGASFDNPKGRAPQRVSLTLDSSAQSQKGSFNIVVVYKEFQGLLRDPLLNYCQFNVIIP